MKVLPNLLYLHCVCRTSQSQADMVLLQIMADALTMWEELGRIENTKVRMTSSCSAS